jgi:hypothetical protein
VDCLARCDRKGVVLGIAIFVERGIESP